MSPRPTIAKRTPTHGPLRIDVASGAIEAARRNVPENKSNLARAVHRLVVSGTRVWDLLRDLEAAEATMTEDIAAVDGVLERGRSNRFASDATSLTAALAKINDCSAPARLPADGAESPRYPYSPHTPKDAPPTIATYQDDDFLCLEELPASLPASPLYDPAILSWVEAQEVQVAAAQAEADASCLPGYTFPSCCVSPVYNKVRGLRPLTVQVDSPTVAAVEVESDAPESDESGESPFVRPVAVSYNGHTLVLTDCAMFRSLEAELQRSADRQNVQLPKWGSFCLVCNGEKIEAWVWKLIQSGEYGNFPRAYVHIYNDDDY